MKAILMSIQAKHLHNILIGKKTIEIRKSVPKDFKGWVYLYCTKPKVKWRVGSLGFFDDELYRLPSGEIKYGSSVELMACDNYTKDNFLSGKVVARFWFDESDKVTNYGNRFFVDGKDIAYTNRLARNSMLDFYDLSKYANGKDLYALHIKQLEIFDYEPMELSEFYNFNFYHSKFDLEKLAPGETINAKKFKEMAKLKKAPQSYMYVVVDV